MERELSVACMLIKVIALKLHRDLVRLLNDVREKCVYLIKLALFLSSLSKSLWAFLVGMVNTR